MGQENKSDDKTQMTGGQALINSLYEEGVRVIFGLPGVQMYHAVIPVLDYPDMKFITTRHEQATTYMADGYSRASGEIGVSMVVPGPGAGQINRDKISKDVGMLHEINDQIDIIKPITKWQSRVLDADKIQDAVKECFYHLRTGRPRPVEIEIPPETLSDLAEVGSYIPEELPIPSIDGSSIEEAAGLLVSSVSPVIWAGGGVNLSDASPELISLAEYLQIPVLTTAEGKGSISDKHYLSLGTPQGRSTGESKDELRDFFNKCDVILAVGTRFNTANPSDSQKVIQIDIDPEEIGRNNNNTLGIVGDAKRGVEQLLLAHFPTYHPRSYFTSSYTGNLGSGYPTALGVKVAKPDKPVISVSGDGGFLFNSQELSTAVQFGINVVAVVFNDGAYGNVKRDMKNLFDNKSLGVELVNPDFMKLADAYGVVGMRADTPDGLKQCLQEAISMEKPVLIEVPIGEMPSPF